jgi:hypothetical protein
MIFMWNYYTKTVINASKEVDLEINVVNIKYSLLARHRNECQNRDIKIAKKSFENVSHSDISERR